MPEPGEYADPEPTPRLSTPEIELWLDHEATRPRPDPELLEQLPLPPRLSVPSLYLLLLVVDPDRWAAARQAAGGVLVRAPQAAPGGLSLHPQAKRPAPACYLLAGGTG